MRHPSASGPTLDRRVVQGLKKVHFHLDGLAGICADQHDPPRLLEMVVKPKGRLEGIDLCVSHHQRIPRINLQPTQSAVGDKLFDAEVFSVVDLVFERHTVH